MTQQQVKVDRADTGVYIIAMRDARGRFIKGDNWFKGKKMSVAHRKALSEAHLGQKAWNKGKHIKFNDALDIWRESGNKPANWQEENPSYTAIHQWLIKNYGRPELCEHCGRTEAKRFEWAKLQNKEYERKRENFIRLCKKCHNDYDGVNAWQQK